ncbi:MAG: acyl-[ACP]--phospholipid O-acyltransferase [Bdellovibrionota bacterium]
MKSSAITSTGFRALLVSQFLGATNDALFRLLVSLIAVNQMSQSGDVGEVVLTGVCFVLPFLLFSPLAGSCADRFSKAHVMRAAKLVELAVMVVACFFLVRQFQWGLLVSLFLLGVHSAFFSPAKYGLLPEILEEEELSRGNGRVELMTFFAYIFGSALGGLLIKMGGGSYLYPGLMLVVFAAVGFAASLLITVTPPAAPSSPLHGNPLSALQTLSVIRQDRNLWLVLLALGYFWSTASLYQMNIPIYAKQVAGLDELSTSLILAVLGIGIGCGSVFAGKVSEGKVELGLVPIGSAGIALASFWLSLCVHHYFLILCGVLVLGLSSGFFVVPLNAFFQRNSPTDTRGSAIAASNSVAYACMLLAYAVMFFFLNAVGLNSAQLLIVVGLSAIAVCSYVCFLMPEMLIRCMNWTLTHTLYRVRVVGGENIPKTGGALIICNHVAYVDPPILLAVCNRPVRFLMYRAFYEAKLINPIVRRVRAIPISPTDNPKEVLRSLQTARDAIKNGELVCIFAEGELTRIGHLLNFKRGFERIMKGVDAPIIPAFIDQIWGSIFSRRDGKFFWKVPRQLPYPVTVGFGTPLPPTTTAEAVRQRILEMSADLASERKVGHPSLHAAFLHSVKRKLFRPCLIDSEGHRLSYLGTLVGSLALRKRLLAVCGQQKMVGVMLPPSIAGALTNVALSLSSRVPVNLNFTASSDSLDYAVKQCELANIITSRAFLEKLGAAQRPGMIFLEDIFSGVRWSEKILSSLALFLLPKRLYRKLVLRDTTERNDIATVIFSSGSTAEPKGVILSHGNIASNIQSLYELFQLSHRDAVLGVLPFFHSFGYTATLWLPLLCGIRAVYHPNPMDAAMIGELVQRERVTLMMSTPTFLLGYIRKCTAENFRTLRYVVTGAEKLKDRIAQSFFEKFQIQPMEGYGCTELSPVAMMNIPGFKQGEFDQVGHKPGTVGHPLPGVAIRIVDPDSFEQLAPGAEGLLLVRGPNVMIGYLGNPQKTAEAIRDGWYVTGDIAKVDDDGFVTITDRLSRFSKIAGEMVPHVKIEEAIQTALGETETVCVVTAVPDDKKGEKLVVLATKQFDVAQVTKLLSEKGLPNLWIPKKENFHVLDALPYLGSGKLDLKTIKKLALDRSSAGAPAAAVE